MLHFFSVLLSCHYIYFIYIFYDTRIQVSRLMVELLTNFNDIFINFPLEFIYARQRNKIIKYSKRYIDIAMNLNEFIC